jgi:C_GCAxxG_C_C family probable redox protein
MGMDYQQAIKVTGGFGGGMYLGSVCGAVSGAIMAIGLKHGGVGMQPSIQTAIVVRKFADRFKEKNKSINCPDLIGVDLSKIDLADQAALNEFYKKALASGQFARCGGYVKDATTIVTEILNENAK